MAEKNLKKFIVVTGVSRGLGRALTNWFVAHDHIVAGTARSTDAIAELSSQHPQPNRFDAVDHADKQQVDDWVTQVLQERGPPDLLINNAATINANAPLWEVPDSEFSMLIDVNIKGVFYNCKRFLPAMIERGSGVVVNLSSGWGRSVAADVAPYCASKWAIEGLTQALAEDLPSGLDAVPFNPGVINTDMLQSCFGEGASNYESAEQWATTAAPFLLKLNASSNGVPVTAP